MIEVLVKLADAAIRVMNRRTRRDRKPPRHYGYHDLGNANYVFKYNGKKSRPTYRCINCEEVLQLRSQERIVAGSTLSKMRYQHVHYLVCANNHRVPVPLNFGA